MTKLKMSSSSAASKCCFIKPKKMVDNSLILFNRIIGLKENTPFILILDGFFQSSYHLLNEIASKNNSTKILYLSYETLRKPHYADFFIEALDTPVKTLLAKVTDFAKPLNEKKEKLVIVVDSMNYIQSEDLVFFISNIARPNVYLIGVYHTDLMQYQSPNLYYPSEIKLLSYIANSVMEVSPLPENNIDEELLDYKFSRLEYPVSSSINAEKFRLTLTSKRKSGRCITFRYVIDTKLHEYQVLRKQDEKNTDEQELLEDLTTFNLNTSLKQKLAKEQVELPFMEAQENLGSYGGAIVYEFEKDDDYDEEDPYEDPF